MNPSVLLLPLSFILEIYNFFSNSNGKPQTLKKAYKKITGIHSRNKHNDEFPCEILPRSRTVPVSVHQLKPGDIKIVAALGDSLTAGNGVKASTVFGLFVEYRGLAFSIGGDGMYADHVTLPNIIKEYNPDVTGFSLNTGGLRSKNSRFNVADPGNQFAHMIEEANLLVTKMKTDPNIDINTDWKLITILIGNNDLCEICQSKGHESTSYISTLEKSLQILQDNLPRTLVNVIETPNPILLKGLHNGVVCYLLHWYLCSCAAFPKNITAELQFIHEAKLYQSKLHDLAISGKFDSRDDFTVVDQPFFRDLTIPYEGDTLDPDLSFLAPDCFHFNTHGHAEAAKALWNSMFEPVGRKTTTIKFGSNILCPTEKSPYIFTNKNSDNKL